ncbi:MAG: hypothetical protein ABEL76_06000 [Bradymonadaceae bacterium]
MAALDRVPGVAVDGSRASGASNPSLREEKTAMTVEDVQTFLEERLDADVDGTTYRVSDDVDLIALLRADSELVRVQDVQQVDFGDETAMLVTGDSEYFVAADDIFGLKLGESRVQEDGPRPGFGRP